MNPAEPLRATNSNCELATKQTKSPALSVWRMKTLLLLGTIVYLPLFGAAFVSAAARSVSFAVMPSTKKRASAANKKLSSTADPASSSGSSSRAKKQKLDTGQEDPAPLASGDELVRISRRLHDSLKGEDTASAYTLFA